jgi:hypothetical protein
MLPQANSIAALWRPDYGWSPENDGSPWDGLAIAQEFAGQILRRSVGPFLDRASGARAAHIGAHLAGTNGVHRELWQRRELRGHAAQRCLGDAESWRATS